MDRKDVEAINVFLNSVEYEPNYFTGWMTDEYKIAFGLLVQNEPSVQKLFSYGSIYDTILDVDVKIKYSVLESAKLAEYLQDNVWDPLRQPTKEEWTAAYYMENALFRELMLWDLLAQTFNLKENLGKPVDKIYAEQLFHDAQQGKSPNPFAKSVYEYMKQEDDFSNENVSLEQTKGHFQCMKSYRHKMIHRVSPNVTTASAYATEFRFPVVYYLYRLTEDYVQVSSFIQELYSEIGNDLKQVINDLKQYIQSQT